MCVITPDWVAHRLTHLQHIVQRWVGGIVAQEHQCAVSEPFHPGRIREQSQIEMNGRGIGQECCPSGWLANQLAEGCNCLFR
jgi:hypothetical protein